MSASAPTVICATSVTADGVIVQPIASSRKPASARLAYRAVCAHPPRCTVLLADDVHVGNFVEIKKGGDRPGFESKSSQLRRRRDHRQTRECRCRHHHLQLRRCEQTSNRWAEDDVFVGSDTQLIAPVTVGAGVTHRRRFHHRGKDVRRPANSLVARRSRPAKAGSGR